MTVPVVTETVDSPEESTTLYVDLGNGDIIKIKISGYEDPLNVLRALQAIAQPEYLNKIAQGILNEDELDVIDTAW